MRGGSGGGDKDGMKGLGKGGGGEEGRMEFIVWCYAPGSRFQSFHPSCLLAS